MKEKLKQFYHAHSNSRILRGALKLYRQIKYFIKEHILDFIAALQMMKWKFSPANEQRPVRVCFVQQDPNCWNKSKALYDLLNQDARFEVSLLCIPDPFDPDTGSTYRYFVEKGYNAIDARIGDGPWDTRTGKGSWFDLRSLKPDYLFYQQPYNAYLPQQYRSTTVYRYAKICHTPYGFALIRELLECMARDFCRCVYRTYSVSELEKDFNTRRFSLSHRLGLRKTIYYSPLVFANFFQERNSESPSWDFSKNDFRAIWTPRWTTDEKLGGSNFFRYKDVLLSYADAHPDADVLMRPHPMAFDNFVSTGQMTPEQVQAYVAACNERRNTSLDRAKNYDATFWQSSVLVSDVSAVIVEYFVTGKPIIFCPTEKRGSTYLSNFETICSSCYVATNQQELTDYLDQLRQGNDPLASKRQQVIRELFGKDPTQAPEKIRDDLLSDFGHIQQEE